MPSKPFTGPSEVKAASRESQQIPGGFSCQQQTTFQSGRIALTTQLFLRGILAKSSMEFFSPATPVSQDLLCCDSSRAWLIKRS